jgi:Domain of unknown function (DUF1707)/Cell wall-active antibiotics response 4TMS YvqF
VASDPVPDPVPALRASDADRERVVAVLQRALAEGRITVDEFGERSSTAYAARTQDQLAGLTRDLVPVTGTGTGTGGAPALPHHAGPVAGSAPPVVAVFGGAKRTGRWRPARRETVVAVFGGVEIDLREAELPPGEVRLSAWAFFGGVDVTVPEGMRVESTGFALFGGRDIRGGESVDPAAPVLRVHAVTVFGGVNVKAKGPRRPRS